MDFVSSIATIKLYVKDAHREREYQEYSAPTSKQFSRKNSEKNLSITIETLSINSTSSANY